MISPDVTVERHGVDDFRCFVMLVHFDAQRSRFESCTDNPTVMSYIVRLPTGNELPHV